MAGAGYNVQLGPGQAGLHGLGVGGGREGIELADEDQGGQVHSGQSGGGVGAGGEGQLRAADTERMVT